MRMGMPEGHQPKKFIQASESEFESESESESGQLDSSDFFDVPPRVPGGPEEFESQAEILIEIEFVGDGRVPSRHVMQALRAIESGLYRSQVQAVEQIKNLSEQERIAALERIKALRGRQFVVLDTRTGSLIIIGTVLQIAAGLLVYHTVKKIYEQTRTYEAIMNTAVPAVRALEDATESTAKECGKSLKRNFDVRKKQVKQTAAACVLTLSIASKELRDELENPNRGEK